MIPNADEDVEKLDHSHIAGGNIKWLYDSGKQFDSLLKKLNMQLPYDPVVVTLGIYPREMKTYVHIKICIQMFIAALFIKAPNWKQPRCFSTGKWLSKLWYVHSMEHFAALKRNELLRHTTTWMTLQRIMLNEKSQSPKVAYCVIPRM